MRFMTQIATILIGECPICAKKGLDIAFSTRARGRAKVICENESYIHYKDAAGEHIRRVTMSDEISGHLILN